MEDFTTGSILSGLAFRCLIYRNHRHGQTTISSNCCKHLSKAGDFSNPRAQLSECNAYVIPTLFYIPLTKNLGLSDKDMLQREQDSVENDAFVMIPLSWKTLCLSS